MGFLMLISANGLQIKLNFNHFLTLSLTLFRCIDKIKKDDQRPDKFIKEKIEQTKLKNNKSNQVISENKQNKISTVALNRGFSDWSFLGDFINEVSDQIDDGDIVQNLQE